MFQLTTSRRGRHSIVRAVIWLFICFNSRPHEEVDLQRLQCILETERFNSRPHEEVDDEYVKTQLRNTVSTHDLTKRSTSGWTSCQNFRRFQLTTSRRGRHPARTPALITFCVSTHDLTKRSTDKNTEADSILQFQLTTSRRGRRWEDRVTPTTFNVSTHDLTKRSTAIFTQKVFLSKSLFVLIAYNIFILH